MERVAASMSSTTRNPSAPSVTGTARFTMHLTKCLHATPSASVVTSAPVYDAAKSTVRLQLQVRNVSQQPVYGPVRLEIVGILNAAGQPTAERVDSAGTAVTSPQISFAGKLGSADMLVPRGVSESVEIILKLKPGSGFDTALDFRVKGRVTR